MIADTIEAEADAQAAVEEPPTADRKRGGGPKTDEGRARAARNAIKHGLRARKLLPEDLTDSVERRRAAMVAEYRPETPYQEDLIAEAARAFVQLDRCNELLLLDLGRLQGDAEATWDLDRELDAEELGARLAADPGRVSKALAGTPHGADWLIRRWRGLAEAARLGGPWDAAQRRLAFDLLGTPAELRRDGIDLPGPEAPAAALIELAEWKAAALEDLRDTALADRDASSRRMVRMGMPMLDDRVTARLRRYEAASRRALTWALAEFRRLKPEPARSEPEAESHWTTPDPHPATLASLPPIPPEAIFGDVPTFRPSPTARPPVPAAAPAAEPASAPAAAPAPPKPMNRRARKAQQKRERLAAKRAGR